MIPIKNITGTLALVQAMLLCGAKRLSNQILIDNIKYLCV